MSKFPEIGIVASISARMWKPVTRGIKNGGYALLTIHGWHDE